MSVYTFGVQSAIATPFDNSTNGYIADNVQAAIEESKQNALSNDRYPFECSYNGNANTGRYLEIVPSVDSLTAPFIFPELSRVVTITAGCIANSTGTIGLFKLPNLTTPVYSFSFTNNKRVVLSGLSINGFNANDELAIRVTSGSLNKPYMRVWVNTAGV